MVEGKRTRLVGWERSQDQEPKSRVSPIIILSRYMSQAQIFLTHLYILSRTMKQQYQVVPSVHHS